MLRHKKTALIPTLVLALALAFPSLAATKIQGYVQQGGQSVSINGIASLNKFMRSYPGATVYVCVSGTGSCGPSGTGTLASIYSTSTLTPKVNPFTADTTTSAFSLFITSGCVDITFSGGGITTPITTSYLCSSSSSSSFDVTTYGADPLGVLDSATSINSAISAACSTAGGVVYFPSGTYKLLATGISIPNPCLHPVILRGEPNDYTGTSGSTILSAATMNATLSVLAKYCKVEYLRIDANRLADYGVYFNSGTLSTFSSVHEQNALLDGYHSESTALNQLIRLIQCTTVSNGKTYATAAILGQYPNNAVRQTAVTGTAAIVAASGVITITGGPNVTTLGIRTGFAGDMVRVGSTAATAFYGQILSVAHIGAGNDTITLQPSLNGWPTATLAGQDYAIGIGAGWYEESNGGNGFCHFEDSIFRGNGAVGVFMNALYGDLIEHTLTDFSNFSGVAMGLISNNTLLNQPVADHVYMEANIGPDYVLGSMADGKVDTPSGGSAIFSIGGAQANGVIIRGGQVESMALGKQQNFIIQVNNNGGTFRHRTLADYFSATASLLADRVVAQTAAYGNTPILTGGATAFVNGFGFYDAGGGLNYLLIDTVNAQNIAPDTKVYVEISDAGNYRAAITISNANINGVTKNRLAVVLVDPATGAFIPWTVGSIAAGKSVAIRFDGLIR